MIASLLCLALSIAMGVAVVWRYAGLNTIAPRWAALLAAAGGGTMLGIGAGSTLYTLVAWVIPGAWFVAPAIEAAVAVWCGYSIRQRERSMKLESRWPARNLAAAGCLVLVLLLATAAVNEGWTNNPQGNWDAWSIWNLRAKFLAAPLVTSRAWSAALVGSTHPEYPLLLPGAVARCWMCGSNAGAAGVPEAAGLALFLALVCAVTGAIAVLRGGLSGLVAGIVVAATPALLAEVPAQYADVPLAAFMAGAAAFTLLGRPLWAGVLAGLAAWTKDEGVFFCAVLLAAVAVFRREEFLRVLAGAAPGAAVAGAFKLFLAPQVTGHFGGGLLRRLLDGQRYSALASSLFRDFGGMGTGWYHPALPLAAYSAGAGVTRGRGRDAWFATAVAGATLGGYCGVMIATPADIHWQIDTALRRLLVQWWPLAVLAVSMWQRAVVEMAEPATARQHSKKQKRRQS